MRSRFVLKHLILGTLVKFLLKPCSWSILDPRRRGLSALSVADLALNLKDRAMHLLLSVNQPYSIMYVNLFIF